MFARKARILIPDNTPLSVLALLGEDALNWLFVPGAEVWITDMVQEEALRDPDPGNDPRLQHREALKRWFQRNATRIRIQPTREGDEYRKAMRAWQLAGHPPDLKPSWSDRGENSVFQAMRAIEAILQDGEAVLAIMDDRAARVALQTMNLDLDMMSTESFVIWMADRFSVKGADTAWHTIKMIMGNNAPSLRETDDEPVSTFKV